MTGNRKHWLRSDESEVNNKDGSYQDFTFKSSWIRDSSLLPIDPNVVLNGYNVQWSSGMISFAPYDLKPNPNPQYMYREDSYGQDLSMF